MSSPSEPRAVSRRFLAGLLGFALLGLVVRLAYGLLADLPRGVGDDVWYHEVANELFAGRGFSDPFRSETPSGPAFGDSGKPIPTAFHPPLFPALLAVFSELGLTSYSAHQAIGCALGACTVAAIGLAGRQLGGERLGLVAAGIAAVFLPLAVKDSMLMTESLYGLLVALVLLAALRLRASPTPRGAALLGVVIGLAALTRGEALALALLLAPVVPAGNGRRRRNLAVMVLALVVVVAPWSIRNTLTFDEPVLVTTVDGSVVAGANLPSTYSGALIGAWDFNGLFSTPAGRTQSTNEAVQSRRWRREAIEYAGDHLSRLPVVVAVRVARTWSLYPFDPWKRAGFAAFNYKYIRAVEPFANLLLYAVVLLAALGGFALRRRRAELWVLLAPLVLVTLVSVFAFGDPRFRHAADVALPLLAAAGVERLRERRISKARGRSGGPAPEPPPAGGAPVRA
jgi:4-amino-4-deoxy-L-arabinose transferase-like glycosyltransferase